MTTEWLTDAMAMLSSKNAWIVQVFIVVLLTLIANYIATHLLNRLAKQVELTQNLWDDAVVNAARKPLAIAIWVIGFSWAADIVKSLSDAPLFDVIAPVREMAVVVLLTWFLVRFVRQVEGNILAKPVGDDEERVDEATVHAMSKLLRLAIMITAALVILQTLGYSISGVLAFGGIGGIAVGFAAKDLLANFFGGLMIYLDRPFSIGDWVRSPDKNIEGTVEHIGWRQTRIRTFDKRPLYVPNATFTQISVENPSRMLNRRIYETIGIRYDDADKMAVIVEQVKAMLREHEAIDQTQTLMVNFVAFAESSLNFFVYCFTKTTDWQQFHHDKQDVMLKILAIIASHDAEVAFPTQVLHVHNEATADFMDAKAAQSAAELSS